ncbi:MAG TPA: TIGR03067 domain-containing protein [Gemmataceae bacterium]|nr:TIGR03067 domain-containing protein [Gemmataceae bacterium]
MRQAIATVAVLAAGLGLARADDAAKKLEGTYELLGGTIGGKDDPKIADIKSVVIKDGTISIKTENRDDDAKFTLDPTQKPAHIDLVTARGNNKIAGIYEAKETADGLQLTIAFVQGEGGARPKDFKGEGEKTVLLKLLRKKPAKD